MLFNDKTESEQSEIVESVDLDTIAEKLGPDFSPEKTKFKQLYTPLALPGWWP